MAKHSDTSSHCFSTTVEERGQPWHAADLRGDKWIKDIAHHSLTHEILQDFFNVCILVNDSGFDPNDVLEDETT